MKKQHRIPYLGLIGSFLLSLALIHFFFAEMVAKMTGMSVAACYGYGVALLVVVTIHRAWCIAKDRDVVTQLVDRLKDK